MFGYVLINKPELKIREFEVYQSYYCGLCHCLQKRSGVFGRMTLNYDITFLTMLLSDLYDPETEADTAAAWCILYTSIAAVKTKRPSIAPTCAYYFLITSALMTGKMRKNC